MLSRGATGAAPAIEARRGMALKMVFFMIALDKSISALEMMLMMVLRIVR